MTRVLALVAVAALLTGTSAFADETVATATSADAHPPGVAAPAPGPVAAMRPHGELSVGVGTRGYREVGGSVCQPLPGGAFVAVTAGSSRIGR